MAGVDPMRLALWVRDEMSGETGCRAQARFHYPGLASLARLAIAYHLMPGFNYFWAKLKGDNNVPT
jgi:hypothetical protein